MILSSSVRLGAPGPCCLGPVPRTPQAGSVCFPRPRFLHLQSHHVFMVRSHVAAPRTQKQKSLVPVEALETLPCPSLIMLFCDSVVVTLRCWEVLLGDKWASAWTPSPLVPALGQNGMRLETLKYDPGFPPILPGAGVGLAGPGLPCPRGSQALWVEGAKESCPSLLVCRRLSRVPRGASLVSAEKTAPQSIWVGGLFGSRRRRGGLEG